MTFIQCWTNVEDVGPTLGLGKWYTNVLCLLGCLNFKQNITDVVAALNGEFCHSCAQTES